jgi:uncharacterized protein DUF4058
MPSPIPGMDPFLESSKLFPDLHDSMVTRLRDTLNEGLPAPYFAGIASRVWIEATQCRIGPDVHVWQPDVGSSNWSASIERGVAVAEQVETLPVVVHVPEDEFREPQIEIYAGDGGERLVTVVEVLSLTNKTPGEHGRDIYLQKQREVLQSQVHLVEIDLLRGGTHTTAVPLGNARHQAGAFDYHVCVHRFDRREDYFVYPMRLGARLPIIEIPLLPGDPGIELDLQAALDNCYDAGLYARRVKYAEHPPDPPVTTEQDRWLQETLRAKGL